ncbi:MAG: hypothetical protein F4X65_14190 [Chloroflexi bacterium]|nr:hypothetical protein [Chloroflexota bacterium]
MNRTVSSAPTALTDFPPREIRQVSYDELCRGVEALCNLIESSQDGWKPDAIVAVVRGGLVPATHVCHFFNRPIYFIYNDVLLDKLEGHKRILIVDEINDTGRAFQRIRDGIFSKPPNDTFDVRYAVLYTRHTTQFKADYFLDYEPFFLNTPAWQQFPWERE